LRVYLLRWNKRNANIERAKLYNTIPEVGQLSFYLVVIPRSRLPPTRTAMSNPNGLLGQKSCHYLNQGRTFYDILMRAAY